MSRSCQIPKIVHGDAVHIVETSLFVLVFFYHSYGTPMYGLAATSGTVLVLDLSSCGARSGTVEAEGEGRGAAGIFAGREDTRQLLKPDHVSAAG
jgi:hypothetical protein